MFIAATTLAAVADPTATQKQISGVSWAASSLFPA